MIAGLDGGGRGLHEATEAVLAGPLAVPFWGIRVGIGLALPLLLVVLPFTRTLTGLLVASVGALIGVFADRWLFVAAGQIAPVTASAGVVSNPYAVYGPSPVEVAIVLGAAAFVALGYTLAERYLDLCESDPPLRLDADARHPTHPGDRPGRVRGGAGALVACGRGSRARGRRRFRLR